jgi:hypothetical protein
MPAPFPLPPRRLDSSLSQRWRELESHERAILALCTLPLVLVIHVLAELLAGPPWNARELFIPLAIALVWTLLLAAALYFIIARVGAARRICREGVAVHGIILGKRQVDGSRRTHYHVRYLFEHPATHEPVRLEASVTPHLYGHLVAGQQVTVLLDLARSKKVLVYEFSRVRVLDAPAA